MLEIPLWRAGREQSSLDRRILLDYRGSPVAEVQMAPALLIHRAVAELRGESDLPATASADLAPLWRAIAEAGRLVGTAELGGCSPEEHARLVTRATGAPLAHSREALAELARGMAAIEEGVRWQAPLDALRNRYVRLPDGRGYAWVPVGQVLGFVAPSNHPAVHLTWILALAMGWCVAVRPGAEDPLTPWRLILALREAGFPTERIALLPGGHDLVPALIEACDRTVAYGGPALGRLIGQDRRVLFNGPGHSKVLVDGPVDLERTLDFLMECIAHDGGRKCTCASAVVLRGEAPGLLDGLADRLAALPLLDPLDPDARVPVFQGSAAPAELVVVDGLRFIRPALVQCGEPFGPPFGAELPTSWATAAALPAGADPMPLLRGSLAVTLLSGDRGLAGQCLAEPSILKVFVGRIPPWTTEVGAPHHGLLSQFLFTAKAHREEGTPWT